MQARALRATVGRGGTGHGRDGRRNAIVSDSVSDCYDSVATESNRPMGRSDDERAEKPEMCGAAKDVRAPRPRMSSGSKRAEVWSTPAL